MDTIRLHNELYECFTVGEYVYRASFKKLPRWDNYFGLMTKQHKGTGLVSEYESKSFPCEKFNTHNQLIVFNLLDEFSGTGNPNEPIIEEQ